MKRIVSSCCLALSLVNCEGTNTGNPASGSPLTSFEGSECRKDQLPPGGTSDAGAGTSRAPLSATPDAAANPSSRPVSRNPDDYFRLACVTWETTATADVDLRLWNFVEACGVEWAGASGRTEDGALHLAVFDKDCQAARCGSCVYDLGFSVRAEAGRDLAVFLDVTDAAGKSCQHFSHGEELLYTLPLATEPSGARCRALATVGLEPPKSCARHESCGDSAVSSGAPACPVCPNGDVCGAVETGNALTECLAPCTTDTDCGNPSMACRGGGCAIVNTW